MLLIHPCEAQWKGKMNSCAISPNTAHDKSNEVINSEQTQVSSACFFFPPHSVMTLTDCLVTQTANLDYLLPVANDELDTQNNGWDFTFTWQYSAWLR